uniref:Sepiapterin reductase n=1 Tax=Parastrongyloides trichosuri TaxID=131310 RepID=A0A0N4ZMQ1_PARTI
MGFSFDGKKIVAVITGATQGIGLQILISLSKIIGKGSIIYIVGRDDKKLYELSEDITNENVKCTYWHIDFENSDVEAYEKLGQAFKGDIMDENIDIIGIFHIAGNIGDIKIKAQDVVPRESWDSHFKVNVSSMILLNNYLLKPIIHLKKENISVIVSITSLLAIKSFPCFSQYSVGHAAREAFFRSLAVECPELKILSYSPGPVKTRLRDYVKNNAYDSGIREAFSDEKISDISKQSLAPEATIGKLFEYLKNNDFQSGSRIDFFDI